jgi:hypothetical protein
VHIEILHVPDCPNLDRIRTRLREALRAAGVTASVRELEVATPDAAARAGMRGSPTLLIEGRDPFAADAARPSLSCRLYRTASGVAGAPDLTQLVEAVSR